MNRISDYKKIEDHIVGWMKSYLENTKLNGFVVGVSGGIDSAVVSTLAAKTGAPVILLEMPIKQGNNEVSRAKEHIKWLKSNFPNVQSFEINLNFSISVDIQINLFSQFINQINNALNIHGETEITNLAEANSRSRLRMTMLYYVATINKLLVLGTGNKVEDFGVGFYTKYGDGGVDISPIADLYKSEVRELGRFMGVSELIVTAAPTDGLWDDGRTDETQLGASYEDLEWAMDWVEKNPRGLAFTSDEFTALEPKQQNALSVYKKRFLANKHKMEPIPVCQIKSFLFK